MKKIMLIVILLISISNNYCLCKTIWINAINDKVGFGYELYKELNITKYGQYIKYIDKKDQEKYKKDDFVLNVLSAGNNDFTACNVSHCIIDWSDTYNQLLPIFVGSMIHYYTDESSFQRQVKNERDEVLDLLKTYF